jgi:hypothetical protein
MKALLVIALATIANANPAFYYHTGYPYAYAHHPYVAPYVAPAPVVPVNTCKNDAGVLVPCAVGVGSVYAHADVAGLPLVPGVAAPAAAAEEAPAAEEAVVSVEKREATAEATAEADPEAEADSWYYGYYGRPYHWGYRGYYGHWGHPFYGYGYYGGYGCRNGYGAPVPCAGK